MYEKIQSKSLTEPNDDTIIWKYLELPKFLDLLIKSRIFLCRVDKFRDPYEGYFKLSPSRNNSTKHLSFSYNIIKLKQYAYVDCWHMSEIESAAMWDIYSKSKEGVAICCKFKDLKECLNTDHLKPDHNISPNDQEVRISSGKIKYKDPKASGPFNPYDHYFPFFLKRKSFDFEKELRLIFLDQNNYIKSGCNDNVCYETGRYKRILIEKLLKEVYIHPLASDYHTENIKTLTNFYFDQLYPSIKKPQITQSKLYKLK